MLSLLFRKFSFSLMYFFLEIFIVEEWQVIEYGLSRTFLRGVYVCSIYLIEFQIFRGGDDDDKKLLVQS